MRQILFRAKRIGRIDGFCYRSQYQNGDWVYGLITKQYSLEWQDKLYDEMTDIYGVSGIEIDRETVGQFTGFCDKNDKKMFEGDIVKVTYTEQRQYQGVYYRDEHSCVEEVIYSEKSACFMLKIMCEDIPLYRPLHNFGSQVNIKELEVIGNKWDNPELLEEL